jgi:anti-anti-sigma regulatory factor
MESHLGSGDGRLLRIIETEADGITTVHLEGSFFSAWVDEVRSAVARRAAAGPVRLDLTELRYADRAGIELLRALQGQGIEIASSSPYSSALL